MIKKIINTLNGTIDIYHDKITILNTDKIPKRKKSNLPILAYLLFSFVLLYLSYKRYDEGELFIAVFLLAFSLYIIFKMIFALIKSLKNRKEYDFPSEIKINDIVEIKIVKTSIFFNPVLEITYNIKNKIKATVIFLSENIKENEVIINTLNEVIINR